MAKVKEGAHSDLSVKADGLVYLQIQVSKEMILAEILYCLCSPCSLPQTPCFFTFYLLLLITANIPGACALKYGGKKNKKLRQGNGKMMPIE